jgi:hypothetical protein
MVLDPFFFVYCYFESFLLLLGLLQLRMLVTEILQGYLVVYAVAVMRRIQLVSTSIHAALTLVIDCSWLWKIMRAQ